MVFLQWLTNLLCVLKASLTCGVKEPYDVTAAHVAHFVDAVISKSTKLSISYSSIAGLVTLVPEKFHIARSGANNRFGFEFEPIYECVKMKSVRLQITFLAPTSWSLPGLSA